MAQRRIIQIDAAAISAHAWRRGSLREELRIAPTPDSLDSFADYLKKHASSIFYVLADVAEEGFATESFPYVRGADREAMLQRKLSQLFYGSPLSTTVSLGREKSGRRDERALFLALNRPQFFEPWLEAMRSAEAQLGGLYTRPVVESVLAERLGLKPERLLLLSIGRAGIRQTFIEEGHLRFSRLTPVAFGNVRDVAQACGTESAKLHQYLISQRMVPRSAALPVLVLIHPGLQATFAESCRSTEELRFDFLDLPAAARTCGLKTPINDHLADPLVLHLLAQRPPALQFAPAAERRFFQLWQARTALTAAGVVLMLGCFLFAAKQWADGDSLSEETARLLKQAQAEERNYKDLLAALPPMPTSLDSLRGVVARYDELQRRTRPPGALLIEISRALEVTPEVEIDAIDWALTDAPEGVGTARRETGADTASGGETRPMFSVAVISGTLPASQAFDQRGQLETMNSFVANLRRNPELQVTVLRQPVDFESGKSLRGGTETQVARDTPRFTLRVAHRL